MVLTAMFASFRSANIRVHLTFDEIEAHNLFVTHTIRRDRVLRIGEATVAGQLQTLKLDYEEMPFYARRRGGLPLDAFVTLSADRGNALRRTLMLWRNGQIRELRSVGRGA